MASIPVNTYSQDIAVGAITQTPDPRGRGKAATPAIATSNMRSAAHQDNAGDILIESTAASALEQLHREQLAAQELNHQEYQLQLQLQQQQAFSFTREAPTAVPHPQQQQQHGQPQQQSTSYRSNQQQQAPALPQPQPHHAPPVQFQVQPAAAYRAPVQPAQPAYRHQQQPGSAAPFYAPQQAPLNDLASILPSTFDAASAAYFFAPKEGGDTVDSVAAAVANVNGNALSAMDGFTGVSNVAPVATISEVADDPPRRKANSRAASGSKADYHYEDDAEFDLDGEGEYDDDAEDDYMQSEDDEDIKPSKKRKLSVKKEPKKKVALASAPIDATAVNDVDGSLGNGKIGAKRFVSLFLPSSGIKLILLCERRFALMKDVEELLRETSTVNLI